MIRGIAAMDLLSQPTAEKLVKTQEQINQLHEVLGTLRLEKQNALVRRLVRKTQDGTIGKVNAGDDPVNEEDENVSFGDTTNTYNVAEQAKAVAEKAAPSVLPYVLAAALGGGGLGAAAMAIPWLFSDSTPAPVVQPAGADADTQYDLTFKE